MTTEFFMPMIPPTVTHQEKQITVKNGKPVFYEPPRLSNARVKLTAYLSKHVPESPYCGAVRLIVKWCFPKGRHHDGEYKTTRPDTDNLILLLKNPIDNRIFEERLLRRLQSALPIAVSYNPLRHLRRLNSDR